MKSNELSWVCYPWALWIGKHFSLHLHVLLTGLHWRIWNKYVKKPEKYWMDFIQNFWKAWLLKKLWILLFSVSLLTSALPLIPCIRLHKSSHYSKGNPTKAPLHTCTGRPCYYAFSGKLYALAQSTMGCFVPLFSAEFLAFSACNYRSWEASISGMLSSVWIREWQFLGKKKKKNLLWKKFVPSIWCHSKLMH